MAIHDDLNDGTCCLDGKGWFTITASGIQGASDVDATVLWSAAGDEFESELEVYIRIDELGAPNLVNYPQ